MMYFSDIHEHERNFSTIILSIIIDDDDDDDDDDDWIGLDHVYLVSKLRCTYRAYQKQPTINKG